MKAIILAAGEGSRLRPYTSDRPKCLVEIEGKSLIERQLEVLKKENINSIILVGGYYGEMLRFLGFELRINHMFATTNMVWSLFCAEQELEGDIIISYGDIVYSPEVLRMLLASEQDIAVAIDLDWESYWRARNENPLNDAETLKLASNGQILEIGQKPKSMDEIEGQYMGLMKFTSNGLYTLKKTFHEAKVNGNLRGKPVEKAYMTDLLQEMIGKGYRINSVPVHGGWVEVDTVNDLKNECTIKRLKSIELATKD